MTVERAREGPQKLEAICGDRFPIVLLRGLGRIGSWGRGGGGRKFRNLWYGSREVGSSLIVKPVTEFCSLEGWSADERKGETHCEGRSKGVFIV